MGMIPGQTGTQKLCKSNPEAEAGYNGMTKKDKLKAKGWSSELMWKTKKPKKIIREESDIDLVQIKDLHRLR